MSKKALKEALYPWPEDKPLYEVCVTENGGWGIKHNVLKLRVTEDYGEYGDEIRRQERLLGVPAMFRLAQAKIAFPSIIEVQLQPHRFFDVIKTPGFMGTHVRGPEFPDEHDIPFTLEECTDEDLEYITKKILIVPLEELWELRKIERHLKNSHPDYRKFLPTNE